MNILGITNWDWWETLQDSLGGVTVNVVAALLAVLIGGSFARRWRRHSSERWNVRRVRQSDDSVLAEVHELLKEGIPESQVATERQIRLWISEDQVRRGPQNIFDRLLRRERLGDRANIEYMIVAERGFGEHQQLGAVYWATYYPKYELVFIPYVAHSKRQVSLKAGAGAALHKYLHRDLQRGVLKSANGFVFEVDDPIHLQTLQGNNSCSRAKSARARMKLFHSTFADFRMSCYKLEINYSSPLTAMQDDGTIGASEPMALMFALRKPLDNAPNQSISAADATRILNFMFDGVYGGLFDWQCENHGINEVQKQEYKAYLTAEKSKMQPDSTSRIKVSDAPWLSTPSAVKDGGAHTGPCVI